MGMFPWGALADVGTGPVRRTHKAFAHRVLTPADVRVLASFMSAAERERAVDKDVSALTPRKQS